MSFRANAIYVMIAYPSDVAAERAMVRDEISKWNDLHAEYLSIVLLPLDWKTHGIPGFGGPVQSQLDESVLHRADILIAIFWTRIGTATENYLSGTVEEISRHARTGKSTMLFFSRAAIPFDKLPGHSYEDVAAYKESISPECLYGEFNGEVEFREIVRTSLTKELQKEKYHLVSERAHGARPELRPTLVAPVRSLGLSQSIPNEALNLDTYSSSLLKAAALSGDGLVLFTQTMDETSIRANSIEFMESQDARQVARWKSALTALEQKHLIEPLSEDRDFFQVTESGYRFAEDLLEKEPLTVTWHVEEDEMKQLLRLQSSKRIILKMIRYHYGDATFGSQSIEQEAKNFLVNLDQVALTKIANQTPGKPGSVVLIATYSIQGINKSLTLKTWRDTNYYREGSSMTLYQQLTGDGEETIKD